MDPAIQVYFDHNATTAVDETVMAAMLPFFRENYGNASSRHAYGLRARRAIEHAREQVALAIGATPSQVIFTSGGSEANNLFIRGVADSLKCATLLVSAVEHPCIRRPAQVLAWRNSQKWQLHELAVSKTGEVDADEAIATLSKIKPAMMSMMLANNETGVIQPVAAVAEAASALGAWVHTDAVQAFAKIPVNFAKLGVHAMTLSSHKIYGPKGAAALIIDQRLPIKPLIYGGGHESGLRSGTENIPAIVGFGVACELAVSRMSELAAHTRSLRDQLESGLVAMGATIFGEKAQRLSNTCYFALPGIEGDTLVVQLDKAGFAVASGAACSSATPGKSHVLEAMQIEPMLARCAVRASLGIANTSQQVTDFLVATQQIINKLNRLSVMLDV
ncbi:MAG: cysteine desulfurase family protein [Nitrosomonas sp.]|nr:cysteine desulfurase family protein [Nitrosomonas sp.]